MGIDAEILVRKVPRSTVTDEWLKEISWRMCEAIGAEKFYISTDWCGRGPRLAIMRTGDCYKEEGEAPGSVYHQDGDSIKADGDECLLELSLCGRYYGIGYERGDILTYCAIAEWLEANIPGCEVWYGGDSSGVCAKPFGDKERRELREHLYSNMGRHYFGGFQRFDEERRGAAPRPPACAICPRGKYCGTRNGFGGGPGNEYCAYHCPGCGKNAITRDGGKTWAEK